MNDALKEKLLSLIERERKAEMDIMLREIGTLSGKEREKKGRAILGLRGKVVGEEFGYKLVRLGRKEDIVTEISVGDEVLVSKEDPLKKGFSATVTSVQNKFLVVAMNEKPSFPLKEIRMDLYVNDTTFRRMRENMESLSEEGERVLRFFQGEEDPSWQNKEEELSFLGSLNKDQSSAVRLALSCSDFFLVHGPFGTGKTKTLVETILQEVRAGRKVLATAESNVAVDNLVEGLSGKAKIVRVGHPARVSEHLKKNTLSYLVENDGNYSSVRKLRREGEKLAEEQKKYRKPAPGQRRGMSDKEIMRLDHLGEGKRGVPAREISSMAKWIALKERADGFFEGARAMEGEIAERVIDEAEVVLSTNSSAAADVLQGKTFHTAVIDEATQATVPSILIPLSRSPRFILAGDHRQLPPTVISKEARELSYTLFEELIKRHPSFSSLLTIQYRMNKTLMAFPSKEFYEGRIKASPEVGSITLADLGVEEKGSPLVFIDTRSSKKRYEKQKKDSFSYYNELEAEILEGLLKDLTYIGVREEQIGVISPYEAQTELLRKSSGFAAHTVDGYQGREREVVVISLVRSNQEGEIGFLRDMRRLNVSLTRAKRKLVITGDSSTLCTHPVYRKLISFIRSEGDYVRYGERVIL